MTYAEQTAGLDCADSYEKIESVIRCRLTASNLKYRELAAEIGVSHSKIWMFHKQDSKLQFSALDKLALKFDVPYYLSNRPRGIYVSKSSTIEGLAQEVRQAIDEASATNISYRKIGDATGISHEWVRCFHVKKNSIDARKLLSLADYLDVPYELCNAATLANARQSCIPS